MNDPRILALICVFMGGMGQGVVAPRLPELLSSSPLAAGNELALLSGFSAAMMYLGIFISTFRYGALADRGLVHRLVTAGMGGYGLSLLGLAQTQSTVGILVLRLMEGLSISAVFVGADFVLGRCSPVSTRAQWLALYGVALSLGLLAGPSLALAAPSLQVALGIVACGAFALGGIAYFRLRVSKVEASPTARPMLQPGALISGAGYGFMEAGLVAIFPALAVSAFGVRPEYCLIVCILAAALSSLGWGWAADRFTPPTVIKVLLGLLTLAPLTLLVLQRTPFQLPGAVTAYVASIAFGGLAGGLYPTGFAWLLQGIDASQYGYASGAFARTYGLGSLAGPLLAGTATHFGGATGFFGIMSLTGAVSLLLIFKNRVRAL